MGRAGSGTTNLDCADAREWSPAPSSRSSNASTGCSLPVILTPIRLHEKGLQTRDRGVITWPRRVVGASLRNTVDERLQVGSSSQLSWSAGGGDGIHNPAARGALSTDLVELGSS